MRQINSFQTFCWLVLALGSIGLSFASSMGYQFYVFEDNQDNSVFTSSMSLSADLAERTQLNLDVELDQVEIAPIVDGVSGATRPSISREESFQKNRGQLILGLNQGLGSQVVLGLNYYTSQEQDYSSQSGAGQMTWSFAQNNARISLKGQYVYDLVGHLQEGGQFNEKAKESYIAGTSFSQDLTVNTVWSLGGDFQYLQGFLSDPYRSVELVGSDQLLTEHHPGFRYRHATWTELKQNIRAIQAALILDYRYYWDTWGPSQFWGLDAHTYHGRLNKFINESWILSLDYRYYVQSEVSFFKEAYTGNEEFYTADYKLSAFNSQNYGWSVAWKLEEWSQKYEWASIFRGASLQFEHFYYLNSLDFSGNVMQTSLDFNF